MSAGVAPKDPSTELVSCVVATIELLCFQGSLTCEEADEYIKHLAPSSYELFMGKKVSIMLASHFAEVGSKRMLEKLNMLPAEEKSS